MKLFRFRFFLTLFLILSAFVFVGAVLFVVIRDAGPDARLFMMRQSVNGYRSMTKSFLRVAIPYKCRLSGELSPYGPGFELELLDRLRMEAGVGLRLVEVPTLAEALTLLKDEAVDMAAGFAVPDEVLADPEFVAGPPYYDVRAVLLSVRPQPGKNARAVLFSDRAIAEVLDEAARMEKVPEKAVFVPEEQEIFERLAREEGSHALMDSRSMRVWLPFFPRLNSSSHAFGQPAAHRWIWRAGTSDVSETAAVFWRNRERDEFLEELEERYFGFLPRKMNKMEVSALLKVLGSKLRTYYTPIVRAAREYNIDPLLLAALIFQESHFNPDACSSTGVRGIMQLTASTASALGVDRLNPVQSIRGGARYLRQMWDSLDDHSLNLWDRWFFTLAGYNQGMGHLNDAMALAEARRGRERKGERLTWRELRHIYPLLTQQRFYSRTRHGYCRGYEAVNFVDRVRFYYYVLNGLVVLDRPEAQYLAPLLRGMPDIWPGVESGRSVAARERAAVASGR